MTHAVFETARLVVRRIEPAERIHALDILRGLALFGMILVHFHQRMRLEVTGPEDWIAWGVYLFVEQKAWGTFAFLFGVGFAILLRRLESRGANVVPIYLRRLAALAAFGLIAQLAFGFSILVEYACWGVPLLLVRRWSTRALLATAALAAAAPPVAAELAALWSHWRHVPLAPSHGAALRAAAEAAAQQGDYVQLLAARWALFVGTTPGGWRGLLPDSNFALFLVGLLAVRHGVIEQPRRHVRAIVGWMIFGAVSWTMNWLVLGRLPEIPIPGAGWPIAVGFGFLQDQWLCFTYIGAVLLFLAWRPAWVGRLAPIGQAGRMALTNYLVQAACIDVFAAGYGFGWKLRPLAYVGVATAFFAAQVAASTAWLARCRYGPLEWVWRTVTYLRASPLLVRRV